MIVMTQWVAEDVNKRLRSTYRSPCRNELQWDQRRSSDRLGQCDVFRSWQMGKTNEFPRTFSPHPRTLTAHVLLIGEHLLQADFQN
jgi:hypothetical protein